MKAVISVIGKDRVGILAMICNECADANVNILDVAQTIVDGMFTMTMSVDCSNMNGTFVDFTKHMDELGKEKSLLIRVMHQDIFDSMHKI